ncbi:MAG: hypothetical protein KTR30_30905 [Saprospiraceae bacterium]|nr:hypothetical protein [Saprospiraceae bacterium]
MWGNKALASLLYLAGGLGVAVFPMLQWEIRYPKNSAIPYRIAEIILAILLAACAWRTAALLFSAPLDYKQADMLPIIQTMAERWWMGESVYAPIDEVWGGMRPIYLPAMWLPYVASAVAKIDLRWIGTSLLLVSFAMVFYTPLRKNRVHGGQLLALLPPILLAIYIFWIYSTLITLSEEPLVVFYYVLLGFAIYRKWPILTGFAIALCLLSRYALVFWVPMYLVFQFLYQSRRAATNTLLAIVLTSTLLLTIGQAWSQVGFFLSLQDSYLEDLLQEESQWKFVAQLANNPGIVKFLPYEKIALWHQVLIWGSLLLPIGILLVFKRWSTYWDHRFFGLCSLKLCLVYFYNLLTIPYSYLFYPSTFLSFLILFAAFAAKKNQ